MITIDKLGFSYGSYVVLKDISMKLEEGRIYGLLGENGVGKTTLLTLLAGLKKNMEGSLDIDGYNPFDRKPSFLSSVYYLPDEVPAPKRTAIEFGRDKGKYWEAPITDSEEEPELGEAKIAGTTGSFTFTGDPENLILEWYDDQMEGETVAFTRTEASVE